MIDDTETKRREDRARRGLRKFGLGLRKDHSRLRELDAGYLVIDLAGNYVVFGSSSGVPYDATLDEVESYLAELVVGERAAA